MYVCVAVCQYVLCLVGVAVCMPSKLDICISCMCVHDIVCGCVACQCARLAVCLSVAPVRQLARLAGSQLYVCLCVCIYIFCIADCTYVCRCMAVSLTAFCCTLACVYVCLRAWCEFELCHSALCFCVI